MLKYNCMESLFIVSATAEHIFYVSHKSERKNAFECEQLQDHPCMGMAMGKWHLKAVIYCQNICFQHKNKENSKNVYFDSCILREIFKGVDKKEDHYAE